MPSDRNSRAAIVGHRGPRRGRPAARRSPGRSAASRRPPGCRRPAPGRRPAAPRAPGVRRPRAARAGVSLTTKPVGAGLQRPAQVARPAERGHDQHPGRGHGPPAARGSPRCRRGRASRRRAAPRRARARAAAATTSSPRPDLGDDLEVGLEVEQRGQGAAHQRLVVGQQQPDRRPPARSPRPPESRKPGVERAGCTSPPRRPRPARAARPARCPCDRVARPGGRCRRRGPRRVAGRSRTVAAATRRCAGSRW